MNPEVTSTSLIARNSSLPNKLFLADSTIKRTSTCHSQLNQMAEMGTSWRLRNNFLQTRVNLSHSNTYKKHHLSRQLCQSLSQATATDQMTKTMLKRLKTEAPDIDKIPQLVTGMVKLRQMHLLMDRDMKRVTYDGKRNREVANDYHCRKTNPGYGRSLCGRLYTS